MDARSLQSSKLWASEGAHICAVCAYRAGSPMHSVLCHSLCCTSCGSLTCHESMCLAHLKDRPVHILAGTSSNAQAWLQISCMASNFCAASTYKRESWLQNLLSRSQISHPGQVASALGTWLQCQHLLPHRALNLVSWLYNLCCKLCLTGDGTGQCDVQLVP